MNKLLIALSAPRWTVLFFVLIGAASWGVMKLQLVPTHAVFLPFALLLLNLSAAIVTLPRFRRDLPLLIFHLALLLLVALFILARLTYLNATTALTTEEAFTGELLRNDRGPLHSTGLKQLHFINQGFYEQPSSYGKHYSHTRNRVRWQDDDGLWHSSIIGDDIPLLLGSYRIYTSSRRGFSPVFRWHHPDGRQEFGSIQLNMVENESPPLNSWTLPNGTETWTMLSLGNDISTPFALPPSTENGFNLNTERLNHQLVLRIGQQRHTLAPGQSIRFDDGELTYLRLDSWMGYNIVYDPTQPWLVATVAVGVFSLIWFYARQLLGRGSWDSDR